MSGSLRVLAPASIATHVVAPAAVAFQKIHPSVMIDVHVDDSSTLAVRDYDVAVLSSAWMLSADVVVRPLGTSELVFCAAPSYLQARGTPAQPDDLRRHRLLRIRTADGHSFRSRWWIPRASLRSLAASTCPRAPARSWISWSARCRNRCVN